MKTIDAESGTYFPRPYSLMQVLKSYQSDVYFGPLIMVRRPDVKDGA